MRFWTTVWGLVRKKAIGPPVAVVAIGLALAAYFLVPSRYVSTASMVLTVPATGGTLETGPQQRLGLTNPLLQFNDALRTTAGILILSTNTPEVAAELGVTEDGPTVLTVNDGRTNPDLLGISTNGPFVYVEVESTSPAVVTEVMRKAKLRIRVELAKRQTALGAPVSTHIGILDVMPASAPRLVVTDRLLGAASGGLLGVVAGLGAAYGVQRLRAARRAGDPGPQPEPEPQEHEPEPGQEREPEEGRKPRPEPEPWPEAAPAAEREDAQVESTT
ncbi:hypothetical protein E1267_20770 [Nonomuraea longispora]|uniref:Polysaccharide chain length determinant N-terminal domain-containing protein n=1 Tax=Nonomuraea longispora TaxID=1848320 RepID=A0A4R4N879_9ACTN|nr:hypothetical protein [Nonomuraea longispora]TDC05025.1 hypothetical protein E1267_20770 [Nonomuraea longispora]